MLTAELWQRKLGRWFRRKVRQRRKHPAAGGRSAGRKLGEQKRSEIRVQRPGRFGRRLNGKKRLHAACFAKAEQAASACKWGTAILDQRMPMPDRIGAAQNSALKVLQVPGVIPLPAQAVMNLRSFSARRRFTRRTSARSYGSLGLLARHSAPGQAGCGFCPTAERRG